MGVVIRRWLHDSYGHLATMSFRGWAWVLGMAVYLIVFPTILLLTL